MGYRIKALLRLKLHTVNNLDKGLLFTSLSLFPSLSLYSLHIVCNIAIGSTLQNSCKAERMIKKSMMTIFGRNISMC